MEKRFIKAQGLECVLSYPDGFAEGEKYPLIIFLHGAGTRGSDVTAVVRNPFFKIIEQHENFPFVVLAPLCSENSWYDAFERLRALVAKAAAYDFVDPSRVYLMGASMGGYATWQLAMSIPQYFAAILPICGGGMCWNADRLKSVPVWAHHGALDDVVPLRESEAMVEAVNKRGGSARLTVYPENGHNAWSDTYKNLEVFRWLLSNVKGAVGELKNNYRGSEIYG